MKQTETVITTSNPDSLYYLDQIIVVDDRFGALYSGANYTAWVGNVPQDLTSDSLTCQAFWENNKVLNGKGNTPDDAAADLFDKLLKNEHIFDVTPKLLVTATHSLSTFNADNFIPINHDFPNNPQLNKMYPKTFDVLKKYWRRGTSLLNQLGV